MRFCQMGIAVTNSSYFYDFVHTHRGTNERTISLLLLLDKGILQKGDAVWIVFDDPLAQSVLDRLLLKPRSSLFPAVA
jgi:hypothetical protein